MVALGISSRISPSPPAPEGSTSNPSTQTLQRWTALHRRPLSSLAFGSCRWPARDDFDPELIVARRTSRVAYDGRPVPAPVLAELAGICSAYGNKFVSSSDPALVPWVLALNRDTLFEDMTNAKTRREVGSWLRFSEREAGRKRDGFSPSCLGFPGWLLYAFFHYRGLFELPGVRQAVRRLYFHDAWDEHDRLVRRALRQPGGLDPVGTPARAALAHADARGAPPSSLRLDHHQRAGARTAARPPRARSRAGRALVHHATRREHGAAAQRAPPARRHPRPLAPCPGVRPRPCPLWPEGAGGPEVVRPAVVAVGGPVFLRQRGIDVLVDETRDGA